MIDFSKVVGLSDEKGVTVQIADASGRVLWKQAPSGATLTITTNGTFLSGSTPPSVTINGVTYNSAATVKVPMGSVIVCSAPWVTMYNSSNRSGGVVKLNGIVVAPLVVGVNPTIYEYTVNKDVTIAFGYMNVPTGTNYTNTRTGTTINITEQ